MCDLKYHICPTCEDEYPCEWPDNICPVLQQEYARCDECLESCDEYDYREYED
jgi:hypothetical protein